MSLRNPPTLAVAASVLLGACAPDAATAPRMQLEAATGAVEAPLARLVVDPDQRSALATVVEDLRSRVVPAMGPEGLALQSAAAALEAALAAALPSHLR